jgi:hypothetical protein
MECEINEWMNEFLSAFDVQGLPEQGLSSTLSWPSKNALCHLKNVPLIEHALHKPVLTFHKFLFVFFKFGAKFDCVTLLEILFLHFRNTSLLYTQLTVKSDMLKLSSWNVHWTSSRNVHRGWCWRHGYSFASCRATRSVSLLFRPTLFTPLYVVYLWISP